MARVRYVGIPTNKWSQHLYEIAYLYHSDIMIIFSENKSVLITDQENIS